MNLTLLIVPGNQTDMHNKFHEDTHYIVSSKSTDPKHKKYSPRWH